MSPERQVVDVGGRAVRVSHLDKVMYPVTGTTKAEVMDYLVRVADAILPQLAGRPVTRIRWPGGVASEKFFEKNTPRGAPEWLRRQRLRAAPGSDDEGAELELPFIDDLAGLVWAANQGALELHTPQWRVGPRGGVRPPDRLVVDLDPGPPAGLDECARVAHLVADRLREDGLTAIVPVTSGSKGMQLYAELPGTEGVMGVRQYAHDIAYELAAAHPKLLVAVMRKEIRGGKVLLDWSQNHPAKTTITPYSLRGRDRPWVAAPRWWDEVEPGMVHLTATEVAARFAERGDPFAGA
ncbi:non-homologous end-joining DNA ligase [Cellulomonas sp. PhB150]|uniref:non-homologous end-joining DNA ligase n=1 Tax=Cellulomonas sp. PhB150 TaxID=2485188 RepID=UPI000F497A61|nr:non-homologous end-joining DNA ligase [Cellulomonas sp. PhB150]ROS30599.1 bifunctional non-homologous end joining protein LigD [Cellulomonas sp. PhB150]